MLALAWLLNACEPLQAFWHVLTAPVRGCGNGAGLCLVVGRPISGAAMTTLVTLLITGLFLIAVRLGPRYLKMFMSVCATVVCVLLLSPGGDDPSTCSVLADAGVNTGTTCCSRNVRMHAVEVKTWARHVLSQAKPTVYLEWGSGGSTEAAALRALAVRARADLPSLTVFSIDSSAAWASNLRSSSVGIRNAEADGLLTFLTADVGKTGEWGVPSDWQKQNSTTRRAHGRSYVSHDFGGRRFDVILVDGRFRVACAVHALRLLKPNGTLLVHDYSRYAGALHRWYLEVDRAGEMGVLKVRPNQVASIDAHPSLLEEVER